MGASVSAALRWAALLAICVLFCALRAMPLWCARGLLLAFFAAALGA